MPPQLGRVTKITVGDAQLPPGTVLPVTAACKGVVTQQSGRHGPVSGEIDTMLRIPVSIALLATTSAIASTAAAQESPPPQDKASASAAPGQTVPPAPPAPASSAEGAAPQSENSSGLPDIVVTAQKREERLQNVGLSVSAFGAATLETQRINTVTDLAKVVPGLSVAPSPNGTPVYTLRGVGFFESTLAASPDVATYLDQAPFALPAFSTLSAFDLERVEVLKGPQGTLFGSNATGGAINFVAAKPTSALKAGFDFGYGRFNTVEASGFISGPLSDTLSVRLAVKAVRGDEWQQSYTRDDRLGKTNTSAARLIIDWRPTDRLKLELNVNGWRDKSDPEAPQIARSPTPADLSAPIGTVSFLTGRSVTAQLPILNYPAAPHTPRAADWSPLHRPFQDTRMFQSTLNASYDLTDDIALTSLTNYIDYRHNKAQNLSGSALLDVDNSGDRANATTFSQEIRIANSGAGDPFRWVLGANYERTKSYQMIDLLYPDASTGVQQGFTANSFDTRQNVRNIAGFGHVEYDVFSKLTLKAGVRYTDSRHSAISGTYQLAGYAEPYAGDPGFVNFVNLVFGSVYTPLLCPGATFVPVPPGGSISINPKTCQSGIFQDVLKEHNTSWSAGVDYKPVHGLLLYANVSKGYKAGAFPISSASSWAQYEAVKQESVIDYEVGFKSTLAGGHATVNGSAFYYDYRNKQLRGKIVDPLFDAIDNLVNVPRSSIKGAELEITVQPVRGFTVRVAGTYLDTQIKDFVGIVGSTNIGPNGQPTAFKFPVYAQFRGVPLPFAPKWQIAASADYSFRVAGNVNAFLGGNLSAQTKSYGSPQLSAQGKADATIDGYAILDLRAGFGSDNDRWKVTFWGKNVTNTYYWTNALRNYDTVVRYAGRPAEYGVSFAWRY